MRRLRVVCVTAGRDGNRQPTNGVRVARAIAGLGHAAAVVPDEAAGDRAALAGADLVLAFGTLVRMERSRPGTFARMRAAAPPSAAVGLWYFDLCHPDWEPARWKNSVVRRVAPGLDFLAMTDHSWPAEECSRRFLHLPQGVDPDEFPDAPRGPAGWDVTYTGGMDRGFEDRALALSALARAGLRVQVYGRNSAMRVHGPAFASAYRRSSAGLVPRPPACVARDYWSNRVYLAAATGTPCLVGRVPGIERHYEPGREAVLYDDLEDLVHKALSLCSRPDVGAEIGRAGRARTMRDHTYAARCRELLRWAVEEDA